MKDYRYLPHEEICELYRKGESVTKIADKYNTYNNTIYSILSQHGVRTRNVKKDKPYLSKNKDLIKKLREEDGLLFKDIAKIIGAENTAEVSNYYNYYFGGKYRRKTDNDIVNLIDEPEVKPEQMAKQAESKHVLLRGHRYGNTTEKRMIDDTAFLMGYGTGSL